MKIFTLAPRENWICDRIQREWNSSVDESLVEFNDPSKSDIIWLLAGWCWNHIHPRVLEKKKVVVTVHHIVPEKFTENKLQEFKKRDQYVDLYHVPNIITASLVKKLTKKPVAVLPYWYDEKLWQTKHNMESARSYLGLPKNDFIIGSFQRDSEGGSGLPKLEKGPDIFCETVENISKFMDRKVHILLGGWRRQYVKNRLSESSISFSLMELVEEKKLPVMYKACDLYLVSSRHEGGPQAILEASALSVPIMSRNVGIAMNVLDPYCIVDMPEQFSFPPVSTVLTNKESARRFRLSLHKENYLKMFQGILK